MKTFRPLFLLTAFLLVVGLACGLSGGGDTPAPTQPQVQPQQEEPQVEPTQPPPPTEPPAPTATEEPAPSMFFTDEFDSDLSSDWSLFTVTGSDKADPDKLTLGVENGRLVWDFDSEYLYAYLFYGGFDYEDVRLEVRADNLGRNNNSVSLICRYDPDIGWYEFNVTNGGLYDILYAEVTSKGTISYNTITNGGSNAIKQGKDVNEYAIECSGNQLTLYINGDEVNSIAERKYSLRRGQVGISVSSFNVLPILIEMDWVKVSEP
ncbi:DUF1080 domain-containing protein [Chloroflexi bacterium CFX6]|nr:DUF1080 domain-containing protein [Chloroflexi bacterium CFX6]